MRITSKAVLVGVGFVRMVIIALALHAATTWGLPGCVTGAFLLVLLTPPVN